MKKSLSMVLSMSVAFSMFSATAFGASSSADFADLNGLDAATKAKFDEMIASGVYSGVAEGTFGLTDKMNRAQFAKVAALIFGLDVDMGLTTSSFADVKSDDPANGYALPYIEAIVKAGITDGVAPDQYDPAGEVTKEQLATFLIRGLGLEAQAKEMNLNDSTVSDWAKGYVALALDKKLLAANEDGTFGGTTSATRDLLVLSSYEAKHQYKKPFSGNYAISSFQATDANAFTVQLNGPVEDTTKATLALTKNGAAVTGGYKAEWSEDKTSVVLTFDNKFDTADWGVTLGGLSNIDANAATAQTSTTKESIEKIEFVNTTDTLPNNPNGKVRVEFKAINQYGKQSTLPASEFDIHTSKGTVTAIGGEQAFYLTMPDNLDRDDHVSITVTEKDGGAQLYKVFTVGDEGMVSKLEVGELLNNAGTTLTSIDALGYAYLDVKAYDQYGFRVEDKNKLNDDVMVVVEGDDLETGNENTEKAPFVDNAVKDSAADLKIRSVENKSEDVKITLNAIGSDQSVTKTISVAASKVPANVKFGAYTGSLAVNDTVTGDAVVDNKMYIPLVVTDTKGNQLSAQDIYDNRDKFTVISSGGIELADEPISGDGIHKGMIAIQKAKRTGTATITVQLKDNSAAEAQMTLNINEERKADKIAFSKAPANYMIAGSENEFKVKLYDQYGAEMKYDADGEYLVKLALTANTGDAASLAATTLSSTQKAEDGTRKYTLQPTAAGETKEMNFKLASSSDDASVDSIFDKSFKFYTEANAKSASYSFKATLLKQDDKGSLNIDGKNYVEVNNLSTSMEVLDPTNINNKLTYEAYLDQTSTNTLLAADDHFSAGTGADGATMIYDNYKGFAKEVKIRAKNAGGEVVAVPNQIVSVSTSDSQVADVATKSADAEGAHWVAGGEAGDAKLTVVFFDGKKNMQTSTINVTAKNEGPVVSSIDLDKAGKTVKLADLQNGLYLWDGAMAEKITVKDQYEDEFVSEQAPGTKNEEGVTNDSMLVKVGDVGYNDNDILKLSFYVSDIVGSNPSAINVDAKTGLVTYTGAAGDVTSFKVNVVAPSGVTAAFDVNVQ